MSAPAAKTVTRTPFKKWCDENVGLLFLIPWIIGFVVFSCIRLPLPCSTALRI